MGVPSVRIYVCVAFEELTRRESIVFVLGNEGFLHDESRFIANFYESNRDMLFFRAP